MSEHDTDVPHDRLVGCRAPMVWGAEQDKELFNFYQNLIRQREKAKPWLQ
jgi:hypothetical protein